MKNSKLDQKRFVKQASESDSRKWKVMNIKGEYTLVQDPYIGTCNTYAWFTPTCDLSQCPGLTD